MCSRCPIQPAVGVETMNETIFRKTFHRDRASRWRMFAESNDSASNVVTSASTDCFWRVCITKKPCIIDMECNVSCNILNQSQFAAVVLATVPDNHKHKDTFARFKGVATYEQMSSSCRISRSFDPLDASCSAVSSEHAHPSRFTFSASFNRLGFEWAVASSLNLNRLLSDPPNTSRDGPRSDPQPYGSLPHIPAIRKEQNRFFQESEITRRLPFRQPSFQ